MLVGELLEKLKKKDPGMKIGHAFAALISGRTYCGYTDIGNIEEKTVKKSETFNGYVDSYDKDADKILVIGP